MPSYRDTEFFARHIRIETGRRAGEWRSLRARHNGDTGEGIEFAVVRRLKSGHWEIRTSDEGFKDILGFFAAQVSFANDMKLIFQACKLAYASYYHTDEVGDDPQEQLFMLAEVAINVC